MYRPIRARSGAGTNFKLAGTGPGQSAGKFFGHAPACFSSKSTINRFGEPFRDGQYSLVSYLFAVFYSWCPRPQQFLNVGGCAPVPYGVGATARTERPYMFVRSVQTAWWKKVFLKRR